MEVPVERMIRVEAPFDLEIPLLKIHVAVEREKRNYEF
jgi:hypothetical protein